MTARRFLPFALVALLAACGSPGRGSSPTPPASPPLISPTEAPASSSAVPPSQPPAPPLPTAGPVTPACVHGWVTPLVDSPRYSRPLGIIARTTGVPGPFVVTDLRYFTGPESPPSDQGYLREVERWYLRLYAKDDPAFRGRFLVEARRFGRGVSAVAPYGTRGFRSPDWTGFQYDSADPTPRTYAGLPGQWEGEPYDFVRGGAGLRLPGLPAAVVGCLDGT